MEARAEVRKRLSFFRRLSVCRLAPERARPSASSATLCGVRLDLARLKWTYRNDTQNMMEQMVSPFDNAESHTQLTLGAVKHADRCTLAARTATQCSHRDGNTALRSGCNTAGRQRGGKRHRRVGASTALSGAKTQRCVHIEHPATQPESHGQETRTEALKKKRVKCQLRCIVSGITVLAVCV